MISSRVISALVISAATYLSSTIAAPLTTQGQAPRAVYFLTGHQPSDSIGAVSVSRNGTLTDTTLTMVGPGGPNVDPVVNTLDSGNEIELVGDVSISLFNEYNTVADA